MSTTTLHIQCYKIITLFEHRGTIVNEKIDKAVGEHFNSRGHQLSDFSYTVLEVVNNPDPEYLKEREALYIRKFVTKRNGLNKSY